MAGSSGLRTLVVVLLAAFGIGLVVQTLPKSGINASGIVEGESKSSALPDNAAKLGVEQTRGEASRIAVEPGAPPSVSDASRTTEPSVAEAFARLETALLGERRGFDGTEASLRSKYAGLSPDQLKIADQVLMKRRAAERDRISGERMSSGRFEEHVVRDGDAVAVAATNGMPTSSFGGHAESSDGLTRIQNTDIPLDEYPQFKALCLEEWWLRNQLHKLHVPD